MQLTTKTVSDTIKGWSLLFPSTNRTQAQEAYIASEFYNELVGVLSEEAFKLAAKKVKRHCRFFPTIADMYSVREEVVDEINRKRQLENNNKALPEYTEADTKEERRLAKERLAIIGSAIAGEITYKEAEDKLQSMIGYAQK